MLIVIKCFMIISGRKKKRTAEVLFTEKAEICAEGLCNAEKRAFSRWNYRILCKW